VYYQNTLEWHPGASPVADTRYLKQRRQGWYFQLKVPTDIAGRWPGANPIVVSLRTRDLSKAQVDRWPLVSQYTSHFEVLRGTRQWIPEEIEEHAEVAFQEALDQYDELSLDEDALGLEIDHQAERIESGKLSEMELALAWARVYAANGRAAALRGEVYQRPVGFGSLRIDPRTLRPLAQKNTKGKGVKFSEAAKRYIEETQRDPAAKLTEQTRGQYEAVYRLFDQWAEQPTLDAVTRAQASEFLDTVAKLDPLWGRSPETKRRTFAEIFKLFGGGPRGLSNRTLNRYATSLGLVWQFALDRGLAGEDLTSPWERQGRKKAERRETEKLPFTEEELKRLLQDKPETDPEMVNDAQSSLVWVMWIAAFSGMRLNEICSLRTADLKRNEGVWYMDVVGAKTEAGDRRVPVHSILVKLGILKYVSKAVGEWLFPALKAGGPDAKRSWYLSKAFGVYRRGLQVIRRDTSGRDLVDFHSFRRSAIKCLEVARVPQSEAAQVVGHERAGITFGTYNPEGMGLRALREVVEKIGYKGVASAQFWRQRTLAPTPDTSPEGRIH
jgi:integrase